MYLLWNSYMLLNKSMHSTRCCTWSCLWIKWCNYSDIHISEVLCCCLVVAFGSMRYLYTSNIRVHTYLIFKEIYLPLLRICTNWNDIIKNKTSLYSYTYTICEYIPFTYRYIRTQRSLFIRLNSLSLFIHLYILLKCFLCLQTFQ